MTIIAIVVISSFIKQIQHFFTFLSDLNFSNKLIDSMKFNFEISYLISLMNQPPLRIIL